MSADHTYTPPDESHLTRAQKRQRGERQRTPGRRFVRWVKGKEGRSRYQPHVGAKQQAKLAARAEVST